MIVGASTALLAASAAFAFSRSRSAAFALFYLAFLPFLTLDPSQGGLVAVDAVATGDNALWKLGVRALGMAGVAALALGRARDVLDVMTRPACLPVLFFFAWALLGLPRASDPWVAFFRLGELLAFFVTGVLLYVERSRAARTHDVLRWHALAMVAPLAAAVVLAILSPEIAFHESGSGIRRMGHKLMNSNVLGFCAAVLTMWSVYVLRRRFVAVERRPPLHEALLAAACLVLGAYVLYHARSRTAALALAVALAILWFPRGARSPRGVLVTCLVALALAGAGLWMHEGIEAWFLRGASGADVASGTGRTGLWTDLLALRVPEAPLFGSGYLNLSEQGGFEHAGHHWNNAHNTYLFALVSTGIPGLLAVLLIVALPVVHGFRAVGASVDEAERDGRVLLFAFMSMVAVASVTGFGVSGYPNVAMLFHYGLYAFATRPLGNANRRPELAGSRSDTPRSARARTASPRTAAPSA